MSTYGIKIGIAGKDVQDCSDEELIYSSEFSVWSVAKEGVITLDGAGNATIAHNLGYAPTFDVWDESAGRNLDYPPYGYVDDTNLYLSYLPSRVAHYKIYTVKIV